MLFRSNVCDGYIRLRHIGLSQSQSEKGIDGVHSVRIEFWPIAYRFRSGHRMRVIVASGAHPRYSRNHGTGEPLGDAVHFQISEQEIFHDDAHPSRVVVPVCV